MSRYVGLIDGEAGNYGIVFPDLPGCTSAADTLDGILPMAIEALTLWSESAIAAGEALPEPRGIEELRQDPDVAAALAEGAAFALVPLLLDAGRRG